MKFTPGDALENLAEVKGAGPRGLGHLGQAQALGVMLKNEFLGPADHRRLGRGGLGGDLPGQQREMAAKNGQQVDERAITLRQHLTGS